MTTKEKLRQTAAETRNLHKAIPDVMTAFHGLVQSASKDGALTARTKELAALAIAVAMRCEGCIVYHVSNSIKHGASREELAEILGVAVEMGGGPASVYSGKALAAFDELTGE